MQKWDVEELRQICSFIQGGLESVTPFLKQWPGLRLIVDTVSTLPNVGLAIQAKFRRPPGPFIKSPFFKIDSNHNGVFECLKWLNDQIQTEDDCCRKARELKRDAQHKIRYGIPDAYAGSTLHRLNTLLTGYALKLAEYQAASKTCNKCGKPLKEDE